MKLTIAKDQLLAGLQAVQNVVNTRTTMAVLSNVRLVATEAGTLEVTGTDLDVSVIRRAEAKVERAGGVTLPAKKFLEIVRELPLPQVDIEVDERSAASVQSGSCFFKIRGLPVDEFPNPADAAQTTVVALPQEKVLAMLKRTSFAVSMEESRYTLNGIFFSFKDGKATLVATDGRRLAMTDEEAEIAPDRQAEFIVPTKAIAEVIRLLSATGNVDLKFGPNQVRFDLTGEGQAPTTIVSKLVEGTYPNYQQVIPREVVERVTLAREEFLGAVRRSELMTTDKNASVKLTFSRNQVGIASNTPEVGEARETISVGYKGKDFAIAFNPGYLRDPLEALDTDEVYFDLIDELSPGVIKAPVPFLYVIMPMRIS